MTRPHDDRRIDSTIIFSPGRALLRGVALLLSLAALSACDCNCGREGVHPDFLKRFIEIDRHRDDNPATVVFDPELQLLAVGRESGRLEIWDTRKPDSRIVREAHSARTAFIAFGHDDGILLTGSVFDGELPIPGWEHKGPRIWDARSGELLLTLPGFTASGPIAESPGKSLYLLADSDELKLYDHRKRQVVGSPYPMERSASITALSCDRDSGLIAVGTSKGALILMTLDVSSEPPKLNLLRQIAPNGGQFNSDVRTLILRNGGRRMVSVTMLHGAINERGKADISEWDTTTLKRLRTYPFTLQSINWASSTAGNPWLVLAGIESTRGRIELVDLEQGIAWRYRANTSHPKAVLLPGARAGLILQSGGSTQIHYLDQK